MIPADNIKWIIENIKPEGFTGFKNFIQTESGYNIYYEVFETRKRVYMDQLIRWDKELYPLFLYEVRKAINSSHIIVDGRCYNIHLNGFVEVEDIISNKIVSKNLESDINLEKAILYIVDKIRGEV